MDKKTQKNVSMLESTREKLIKLAYKYNASESEIIECLVSEAFDGKVKIKPRTRAEVNKRKK